VCGGPLGYLKHDALPVCNAHTMISIIIFFLLLGVRGLENTVPFQSAVASIHSPSVQLTVRFDKLQGNDTQVYIDYAMLDVNGVSEQDIESYVFHIHRENIPGGEMNCSKAGPHFDPVGGNHTNTLGDLQSFEVGDLSGKYNLTFARNKLVDAPQNARGFKIFSGMRQFSDSTLELEGPNSIIGRPIVVHGRANNKTTVYTLCAPIIQVVETLTSANSKMAEKEKGMISNEGTKLDQFPFTLYGCVFVLLSGYLIG
jgi:Cu/Zn superoxide dismutase